MSQVNSFRWNKAIKTALFALACSGLMGASMACSGSTTSSDVASATAKGGSEATGGKRVVKESAISKFEQAVEVTRSNPAQAKDLYKQALKDDAHFAEAWYNLGVIYEKEGNVKEAVDAYEHAIKIRPDWPNGYVNLGSLYVDQGKLDEAEKLFIKVIDEKDGLEPYNAEANLNMGMIYRKRGVGILEKESGGVEPEFTMTGTEDKGAIKSEGANAMFVEAVRYVRRALAGDSNNLFCYENLSAIYYMMNSLEVARLVNEQAVQKYIERNAELAEQLEAGSITQREHDEKMIPQKSMAAVYNTSGLIYLSTGNVAMANLEFKKAVDADPESIDAILNVAGIAVNVQDYATAYDAYNRVLELQPDNVEAYLSKGVAARGLNELEEAEAIYRDIIAKNPKYMAAAYNLAILYQEYYLKLEEAKKMLEDFAANPEAEKQIPGRVKDAKLRAKQIEALWEAQRKAEEEMKKMQQMIEEMERLEQSQDAAGEDG